ncbi:MAG: glycosyltransferase family 1 protein [Candidatus Sumerlaeia bacterium]|nr:glycosyltransferase family 1 protein [Candidatus Sumerlaeia bacterium]
MHLGVNLLHAPSGLTGTGVYAQQLCWQFIQLPGGPERISGFCTKENFTSFNPSLSVKGRERLELVPWALESKNVSLRRLHEWAFLHNEFPRRNIDLFWGPSNFLPWRKTCPYVVNIHDMTFFREPQALGTLRRLYWHRWTHRTVAVADAIITGTHAAKEDILRFSSARPEDITVIPNGTDSRYFLEGKETERELVKYQVRDQYPHLPPDYVFFVGTLTVHKNVPRLLEALALARKAKGCKDMILVMAGKRGFGTEEIDAVIRRHDLGHAVMELGYTSDVFLPGLYAGARCHILPSVTEGFGLPITEAMAAGTPTICGESGATGEVGAGAAVLVNPLSVESIAEALVELWRNDGFREERRALGYARAKQFRWEATAQLLWDVMKRVAG